MTNLIKQLERAQRILLKKRQDRSHIQEIEEGLKVLLSDCQAQVNCLRGCDDVDWDCYDVRNWQNMITVIKELSKHLKAVKRSK